jgi:membrane protease YdiL (CAAX protease family)
LTLRDLNPATLAVKVWRELGFLKIWNELDREAAEHRIANTPGQNTSEILLTAYIFSVVAVSIVLQETLGTGEFFVTVLNFIDNPFSPETHPLLYPLVGWMKPETGGLELWLVKTDYYELVILGYWASWRVLGFLVLPLIAVAAHPRLRRKPLGLSVRDFRKHIWIYAVLFVPVFVAVFAVSFLDEFKTYYPFYTRAHESLFKFAVWELFYIAQFFSLEFFFRGFMIQPVKRYMGSSAIFAMMIPYVMIHITKPLIECFAAVIAGIILGTLALKTRSIWAGFLIHVSVALSMDLLAIWQKI